MRFLSQRCFLISNITIIDTEVASEHFTVILTLRLWSHFTIFFFMLFRVYGVFFSLSSIVFSIICFFFLFLYRMVLIYFYCTTSHREFFHSFFFLSLFNRYYDEYKTVEKKIKEIRIVDNVRQPFTVRRFRVCFVLKVGGMTNWRVETENVDEALQPLLI